MIWDEIFDSRVSLPEPTSYTTIKLIKEKPDLNFFDIKSTSEKETAKDIVGKSFSQGVKEIERWKQDNKQKPGWANFKDSYIQHFARLAPFIYHVKHGGTRNLAAPHNKATDTSF